MTQMMPLSWILFLFMSLMLMFMNIMIHGIMNNLLLNVKDDCSTKFKMEWYW